MSQTSRQTGLPAVVDGATRILIVGNFPSEQSLAARQYYANPRNQFWKILGGLLNVEIGREYAERIKAIQSCGIGLWDVVGSCEREGSMDSAIEEPVFNDFEGGMRDFPRIKV